MPASMKQLALGKPGVEISSVLAKWPDDGRYYSCVILQTDSTEKKCRVRFEDNQTRWIKAEDMHAQIDIEKLQIDQICCCICDDDTSNTPNEIVICDFCQQGYHIECHQPSIKKKDVDKDDTEWICATCVEIDQKSSQDNKPQKKAEIKTPSKKAKLATPKKSVKKTKLRLPKSTSCKKEKVKAQAQADASNEPQTTMEVATLETPAKIADPGVTIEEMSPTLIKAAKALAVDNQSDLSTDAFMKMITDQPNSSAEDLTKNTDINSNQTSSKAPIRNKKATTRSTGMKVKRGQPAKTVESSAQPTPLPISAAAF